MDDVQAHSLSLTFRGIAAVLFGIAAVFWPGITLLTLLYLFSAWILVDGVIRISTGVRRIGVYQLSFLPIVVGLLELGVGVYLLRHPAVTFASLILLIGFLLIIDGIVAVVAALASNDGATAKTLTTIVSVAAVLAGILLLFQPESSGVNFVWILGLYALIAGPMMIAMAMDRDVRPLETSRRRR